ncbi:MAG TPA: MerR family transcriptional regulator [Solirubrobacteraceae bacterium]|nr:MerR family transcriptional regulator [Solirubrobacteraceae bacterium]
MGVIRTNAAAAMLAVSPNTLRSWERRFGFPEPKRTAGGHRQYELAEIEALRSAFEETHNVSSAVALAQQRGAGPSSPSRLRSAFGRFDEAEADRVLEESLAVRSLERTVEEVLLPAVEALEGERDGDAISPEYGFAWRWASGWLAAAQRLAPPAVRDDGVVIFDASAACDLDALHAQALELVLRRRGLRTLTLAVGLDPSRLARALHALHPRAVVLTGHGAPLDALGRLVFAARRVGGDRVTIFDFRGALPETGASTIERLGHRPLAARERLVACLDRRPAATPVGAASASGRSDEARSAAALRAVAS